MKKLGLASSAIIVALLALVFLTPLSSAAHAQSAAAPSGSITQPVTGTAANGSTFNGAYTITRFAQSNGQLTAIGTLSGTLTNALGQTVGTVTNVPVQIPVTATTTAVCSVLHLNLGPLDLNLLGLVVHLNTVVLDITAVPGSGNLLGNLLCSVTHLLDNGGPLTGITNLLNQILANL